MNKRANAALEWKCEIEEHRIVMQIEVDGEPVSKARPRIVRGHAYTPRKTSEYEHKVGMVMLMARGRRQPNPREAFGVRAVFFRSGRQKMDVDNMLKAVLDAGNTIVWADDSQVIEVAGRVVMNVASPRVEIVIYEVDDTRKLYFCKNCGVDITMRVRPSTPTLYCSMKCRSGATNISIICAVCSKEYLHPQSQYRQRKRITCSPECATAYHGSVARKTTRFYGTCKCGKPLTTKRARVCRGCMYAKTE